MSSPTILVAVDGSEHSDKAVEFAAELASHKNADLVLLHVVPDPSIYAVPAGLEEYIRLEKAHITQHDLMMSAAGRILDDAVLRAEKHGIASATTRVEVGSPAQKIVEVAQETEAEMIVLGSRGLGNIGSLLLGSTSQKVNHLAPCTVVTVR
ncbi:MAG TPA: universal stress protein [Acidimicrobiia bacterium]|jgi:nucleotide-binding universal stress UspA family protein